MAIQPTAPIPSVRVPISGKPPLPDGITGLAPPDPLDSTKIERLLSSSRIEGRPAVVRAGGVLERPAEFSLTAKQPFLQHTGWISMGGISGYNSDSPASLNGGNGFVWLIDRGWVVLTFYAERDARYLVDFALEAGTVFDYEISVPGGRRLSFGGSPDHLLIAVEPSESSGWATLRLSGTYREPLEAGRYALWTLYGVTVRRLE